MENQKDNLLRNCSLIKTDNRNHTVANTALTVYCCEYLLFSIGHYFISLKSERRIQAILMNCYMSLVTAVMILILAILGWSRAFENVTLIGTFVSF